MIRETITPNNIRDILKSGQIKWLIAHHSHLLTPYQKTTLAFHKLRGMSLDKREEIAAAMIYSKYVLEMRLEYDKDERSQKMSIERFAAEHTALEKPNISASFVVNFLEELLTNGEVSIRDDELRQLFREDKNYLYLLEHLNLILSEKDKTMHIRPLSTVSVKTFVNHIRLMVDSYSNSPDFNLSSERLESLILKYIERECEMDWLRQVLKGLNVRISYKDESSAFIQSRFCSELGLKDAKELNPYLHGNYYYGPSFFTFPYDTDYLAKLNEIENYVRKYLIPTGKTTEEELQKLIGPKRNQYLIEQQTEAKYDIDTINPLILRDIVEEAISEFKLSDFYAGKGTTGAVAIITKDTMLIADCKLGYKFKGMGCYHGYVSTIFYHLLYGRDIETYDGHTWQGSITADGNILIQFVNQRETGNRCSTIDIPEYLNDFQLQCLRNIDDQIVKTYRENPKFYDDNPMEFYYDLIDMADNESCINGLSKILSFIEEHHYKPEVAKK